MCSTFLRSVHSHFPRSGCSPLGLRHPTPKANKPDVRMLISKCRLFITLSMSLQTSEVFSPLLLRNPQLFIVAFALPGSLWDEAFAFSRYELACVCLSRIAGPGPAGPLARLALPVSPANPGQFIFQSRQQTRKLLPVQARQRTHGHRAIQYSFHIHAGQFRLPGRFFNHRCSL